MRKSSLVGACVFFLTVTPATATRARALQDGGAKASPPAADKAEKDKAEKAKDATPRITTVLTVIADAAPRKAEVSDDVLALPGNSMVLTSVALENKSYRETGEVLRSLPGVDFAYYGQGGIPGGPSIRGYTDRNFGQDIAGHIDGIPLNLFGFVASHGAMDMTMISPDAIERIEVVRGPMSPRYGDFNRGASIDFVTKDGISRPSISIGGGSYGTKRGSATFGNYEAGQTRPSVYATIDGYESDGYSKRQRVGHLRGFGKLFVPIGEANDLSLTLHAFTSEWDAPSYLDIAQIKSGAINEKEFINPTDGGELDHRMASVRFRRRSGGSRGNLSVTGYFVQREWLRFRHDQLISPTQTQTRQFDKRDIMGFRIERSFAPKVFGRPSLILLGSNLQRDDAETVQDSTRLRELLTHTDNVDELLNQKGWYAQGQFSLSTRAKLLAGVRYSKIDYGMTDRIRAAGTYIADYDTSQVSPKVGLAFSPVRNVDLFANYSTGMRSPTPRTEVRNSLASVSRVEFAETRSYEGGLRARAFGKLDLQAAIWRADNTDEIRGIPPGGTQFESLGKSRRDGGEIDARFAVGATRIYGGISWVKPELLTPATAGATHLPDVPDYVHQLGFETQRSVGANASGRMSVMADVAFHGPKDLNTTGTVRSETYERWTGRVTYYHKSRYRIWLGGVGYTGSRYGEAAFLFGTRVGVRANAAFTLETGASWTF